MDLKRDSSLANQDTAHAFPRGTADFPIASSDVGKTTLSGPHHRRSQSGGVSVSKAASIQVDSDYDSDLDVQQTWSKLVDKSFLRTLSAKDLKRQEIIYELMSTESKYVRTLKLMHKVFCMGMEKLLQMSPEKIDQFLPGLGNIINLNGRFMQDLKACRDSNKMVKNLGDCLLLWFSGERGEEMKKVYGYFCSRHLDSVAFYKDTVRTDKAFASFVESCSNMPMLRRLSIPECTTYITQRPTKYILLVEAILAATKASDADYESLKLAVTAVDDVLNGINKYIHNYQLSKHWQDILQRVEQKNDNMEEIITKTVGMDFASLSYVSDASMTLKHGSKMLDVLAVLTTEVFVIFLKKDTKIIPWLPKPPLVALWQMEFQENNNDRTSFWVCSRCQEPSSSTPIFELSCTSEKERNEWCQLLRKTVEECQIREGKSCEIIIKEVPVEKEEDSVNTKELEDRQGQLDQHIEALIRERLQVSKDLECIQKGTGVESREGQDLKLGIFEMLVRVSGAVENLDRSAPGDSTDSLDSNSSGCRPRRSGTFSGSDQPQNVTRDVNTQEQARRRPLALPDRSQTLALPDSNRLPRPWNRSVQHKTRGSCDSLHSDKIIPPPSNEMVLKQLHTDLLNIMQHIGPSRTQGLDSLMVEMEVYRVRAEAAEAAQERLLQAQKDLHQAAEEDRASLNTTCNELRKKVYALNKQLEEQQMTSQRLADRYDKLYRLVMDYNPALLRAQPTTTRRVSQVNFLANPTDQNSEAGSTIKNGTSHTNAEVREVIFF